MLCLPWGDAIGQLRLEDSRFHVEGGSWTSDLSWVRGYDKVLIPMERASSLFHEQIRRPPVPQGAVPPAGRRDQLLPLLGEGVWTAYGAELSRRAADILTQF